MNFKKFLLVVAFSTSLVFASSPQGSGKSLELRSVMGTYLLVKFNDKKLPAVTNSGYPVQEVTGGKVVLVGDKSFRWETIYRYKYRDGRIKKSKNSGAGKYSMKADQLLFKFDGEESGLTGTLKTRH